MSWGGGVRAVSLIKYSLSAGRTVLGHIPLAQPLLGVSAFCWQRAPCACTELVLYNCPRRERKRERERVYLLAFRNRVLGQGHHPHVRKQSFLRQNEGLLDRNKQHSRYVVWLVPVQLVHASRMLICMSND